MEISGVDANLHPNFIVELIDETSVDFYAPYVMSIGSITNILNSPTTTIKVADLSYNLGASISAGVKITVEVSTAAVIRLNATKR
tara:strand:+ start:6697 stop:6951 length:255 start_codon:yes stop_codon:yes gene_type:complete